MRVLVDGNTVKHIRPILRPNCNHIPRASVLIDARKVLEEKESYDLGLGGNWRTWDLTRTRWRGRKLSVLW